MKSQYTIILTIIIALIASMLLLAKIEDDKRTNNQDFWSVYFVDPFGTDNRFVIDNKMPQEKTFHYNIKINENTVNSGDVEISKNDRKLIDVTELKTADSITIIITTNEEEKIIYKK